MAWDEWEFLNKGLVQRVKALNAFLADAYGAREICRAGVIPEAQILMNAEFVAMAQGLALPGGVHAHIAGIDLVRVGEKDFYVLEDNVRTPSGVSYVLENREVMMRLAPELFSAMQVLPVANYSEELLARSATTPSPMSSCSRLAISTAPISSTRSSPTRWASSCAKVPTCSSTRGASTCAPRAGRRGST